MESSHYQALQEAALTNRPDEVARLLALPVKKDNPTFFQRARAWWNAPMQEPRQDPSYDFRDPIRSQRGPYESALRKASRLGHLDIVNLLLPFCESLAGREAALEAASAKGHGPVVLVLLPGLPDWVRRKSLIAAAGGGHDTVVDLLLPLCSAGDIVHVLGSAVANARTTLATRLMDMVPAADIPSDLLMIAVNSGNLSTLDVVLRHPWPQDVLGEGMASAAAGGRMDILERLLSRRDPGSPVQKAFEEALLYQQAQVVDRLAPAADLPAAWEKFLAAERWDVLNALSPYMPLDKVEDALTKAPEPVDDMAQARARVRAEVKTPRRPGLI